MFKPTQSGEHADPIAVLSFTGRGKTVTIETDDIEVKELLKIYVEEVLGLPGSDLAFPSDRQKWMESLEIIDPAIPYIFKTLKEDIIPEEVDNGYEEIDEDDDIEGEDEVGGNTSDGEGDDPDSGGDIDGDTLNQNG